MSGIMAMAPLGASEADCRRIFCRAREIFEEMKWNKIGGNALKHLSMGMSDDFEAAIMEGSTLVRVGTLLFGEKAMDEDGGME
jgi:PLP dependent protein